MSKYDGENINVFNNNPMKYIYWDNLNELISGLALLHASSKEGNNSHLNEIRSIEQELREAYVIYK